MVSQYQQQVGCDTCTATDQYVTHGTTSTGNNYGEIQRVYNISEGLNSKVIGLTEKLKEAESKLAKAEWYSGYYACLLGVLTVRLGNRVELAGEAIRDNVIKLRLNTSVDQERDVHIVEVVEDSKEPKYEPHDMYDPSGDIEV